MLNNTKVKQLKPSESVYRMLDSDGLYVEIKPNGRKFWRHRFRKLDGGYTMTSLGEFPSVTIEAARKLRDASTVAAQYHKNSFEQVARDWIAYKNYVSDKNRDLVWRRIEARLLPNLGKKNIAEIKPQDVLPMLKQIEKEGHLELARRVQNIAAQIFKYAVQNLMCKQTRRLFYSVQPKCRQLNPCQLLLMNQVLDGCLTLSGRLNTCRPISITPSRLRLMFFFDRKVYALRV